MKKQNKLVSQFTEDWLTVKQIMNGMILTEEGYYVTGIKIAPKNIFIMDSSTQKAIVHSLTNVYNMIDYDFWLVIADRPVDISVYLAQLQMLYNESTSGIERKLIMQDINKANLFMSSEYNVVDTEYYILFKEKKLEFVQKRLHNLISGFASCGLNTAQTSNADLRMILDNFLNGGMTTNVGTVMY